VGFKEVQKNFHPARGELSGTNIRGYSCDLGRTTFFSGRLVRGVYSVCVPGDYRFDEMSLTLGTGNQRRVAGSPGLTKVDSVTSLSSLTTQAAFSSQWFWVSLLRCDNKRQDKDSIFCSAARDFSIKCKYIFRF